MKNIVIKINQKFYNPEAYAYKNYLSNNNYHVELSKSIKALKNTDVIIKFMGLDLISESKNIITIHDYASLSTPPLSKMKNFIKKRINIKPHGRIFFFD